MCFLKNWHNIVIHCPSIMPTAMGPQEGGPFFSYFHEGAINISGSPELIDGH